MRRFMTLVLLLSVGAGSASARVWHVEKNGSGDFTVIQQAVDAAAAGDTIRIGPGRFDDRFLWGNPPWQKYTRVLVTKPNLAFIGAGAAVTIIGDVVPLDAEDDHDCGMVAHGALGATSILVSGIGFEHCYFGLYLYDLDSAAIDDCRFHANVESIVAANRGVLRVGDADFVSLSESHNFEYHIVATGLDEVAVDGSRFAASAVHSRALVHVQLEGVSHGALTDCQFTGGAIAIYASSGSGTVEVERSTIDDQFNTGIVHSMTAGAVRIADTVMRRQYKALYSTAAAARWEVERLVIEDAIEYSLVFSNLGSGYIRDSQLARGARYVVRDGGTTARANALTFDMTNNWWGTSDPDSIQAWIYDGNDQPSRPYYFIDWDPYRSVPVSSDKRSLGAVKSLFR